MTDELKSKLTHLIITLERDIITHNPKKCDSCFTANFIIGKLKELVK